MSNKWIGIAGFREYAVRTTTEREDKFHEIITMLNSQERQGERCLFDCGKLGYALIFWEGSWRIEWFDKAENPTQQEVG